VAALLRRVERLVDARHPLLLDGHGVDGGDLDRLLLLCRRRCDERHRGEACGGDGERRAARDGLAPLRHELLSLVTDPRSRTWLPVPPRQARTGPCGPERSHFRALLQFVTSSSFRRWSTWARMRKVYVIGIGAGDPRHMTVQAIE